VSFEWQSLTMLPLFQFDPSTMALRAGVTKVAMELTRVFDGWDLALWFAQPNCWLGGSAPVEVVQDNVARFWTPQGPTGSSPVADPAPVDPWSVGYPHSFHPDRVGRRE